MGIPSAGNEAAGAASSWARLARVTGAVGLGSMVLLFVPIIAISSQGEPSLEAGSADIVAFFSKADTGWVQAAEATASIAMVAFLWFVAGLTMFLARAEGVPAWRSAVTLASGVVLAAYGVLDASWDAATHRGAHLDARLATYAFDVGNLGFANAWLAAASLALAAGWVTLSTGVLAAWTGWCAIVSGVGLVLARYLWFIDGLWFLPYGLFWLWVVAVSVSLIRSPPGGATSIRADSGRPAG